MQFERKNPPKHGRWLAAVVLAIVSGLACAQAPAPAAPVPAQDVVFVPPGDPPVPLLWKVSDEDNAVYLLGSFHLLKPDDYPLSRDANEAFADAEAVVFEMPPEEMNSPQLGLQMMQAAVRTDGTRLDSELPPATAGRLQAWLDANAQKLQASGLTPERLQMFEPWFVGLMISMTEMTRQGLDPKLGLDQHFIDAARFAGKRTGGFETGAQQIAFLDGMDREEQLQFLDEALTQAEGDELQRLHAYWRAGDADAIRDEMATDMRERFPKLYQHINVERNEAWLPKIEQMLAEPGTDDTLVVVGALHLLGEDGVVEKMRAKGYTVERVCSACPGPADGR
ncbi:TraB/GumN family protein [Luteimonas lutimaris]|uniref:TraB/GumN family protein n=1 Tax=Luteimonas lutimaris TaxID=698645 RepID=A0ABP7MC76_9GAMM